MISFETKFHKVWCRQGQRNEYFDIRVKVLWMANAMYQSVILFLIPTYSLHLVAKDKNGREHVRLVL